MWHLADAYLQYILRRGSIYLLHCHFPKLWKMCDQAGAVMVIYRSTWTVACVKKHKQCHIV